MSVRSGRRRYWAANAQLTLPSLSTTVMAKSIRKRRRKNSDDVPEASREPLSMPGENSMFYSIFIVLRRWFANYVGICFRHQSLKTTFKMVKTLSNTHKNMPRQPSASRVQILRRRRAQPVTPVRNPMSTSTLLRHRKLQTRPEAIPMELEDRIRSGILGKTSA